MARRPLALSASRANDFKQCPLLYRFRAIDRLPESSSKAQVRGTMVHSALESLYGLPAPQRVRDQAVRLLRPAWDQMVADDPDIAELVGDDVDGFLAEAERLVSRYYTMEDPTRFEPESCELFVEAETADGVRLRGFVDRIDVAPTGEVRVVDYKTGRSPSQLSAGSALFQMKFYGLMLLRTRGIVPDQLKLMYLGDGGVMTLSPDEAELLRFERTVNAMWGAIRNAGVTGDFQPSPSKLCGWCDHKPMCPSFGGTPPEYPGWPDAA
ncbi:RecB family exonuclease [Hoyosella rhizosphaerae]|uniref:RecB family exonuclease n=1 Tax=Hoyosella rhizosphaerae TaxID=1755582 RepID=UPI00197FAFBD|nr:RecB family exonuclease [Hoyosella rhizosphaerae]MBN4926563.1 RecB family exonuclease [Hoyosella rhizosphaerae]